MRHIQAIGFDLFDTLITMRQPAVGTALSRLCRALHDEGIIFDEDAFNPIYVRIAKSQFEAARHTGIETHNSFWICATLAELGQPISLEDERLTKAIRIYFASFVEFASVIPGTVEMLKELRKRYKLGLLSNFTDGQGARNILTELGLANYFEVTLISGELGYRKPHQKVFDTLASELSTVHEQILFVGDNVDDDIGGAMRSGMTPVWTTYARDNGRKRTNKIMTEPVHEAEASVHRILDWSELLSLLD
ncbi:MAG: HAD family hydrolase [Calditrichia bacterium]